jgi:L-ascorbate metabolism protein UlaG (beta-lactamase superfamily)
MVELEEATLLFDYYNGKISQINNNLPLFVFVSHNHHDHYNKEIFDIRNQHKDITYILSNDIPNDVRGGIPNDCREYVHQMAPREKIKFRLNNEEINIKTLKSTDEGVAFVVNIDDKAIYHAGDLHWWSWIGESDSYNNDMERRFKDEMKRIEGVKFDVAFLPLDPRLEDRFWWGFDYFMKTTDTALAFPMHYWGDVSVIAKLKDMDVSKPYREKIMIGT